MRYKRVRRRYVFNNVNKIECCAGDHATNSETNCAPVERVYNSGFEVAGLQSPFDGWNTSSMNIVIEQSDIAYEEQFSALFRSRETADTEVKTGVISQGIVAPSGCYVVFSFAENLLHRGHGFLHAFIVARVYYDGPTGETDVVRISVDHTFSNLTEDFAGFTYHQRVSQLPVPPTVSNLTVEFVVEIEDQGHDTEPNMQSIVLLDGVSVRAQ